MESTPHSALGVHYLIECSACKPELLSNKEILISTMEKVASDAGAHVVETMIHQFNPHGLSGIVVIAESHLAIHTWPEHNYAAIDIFTCGMPEVAEAIYQNILSAFKPENHTLKRVERTPPQRSTTHIGVPR